jgi:hypothetical protein
LHLVKIITGDEVPNVHAARGRNATVRSGSRKARR